MKYEVGNKIGRPKTEEDDVKPKTDDRRK